MKNQTMVFCKLDVTSSIANVTAVANTFINDAIKTGCTCFDIQQVVVTPSSLPDQFWFTLQVNYYDPSIA